MTAYSSRVNLGGTNNDAVDRGNGNDTFWGGKGLDLLNGGDGADFVSGDRGNDTVLGKSGNNTALGGDGNDLVLGGEGNDSLFGGGGNDTIDRSRERGEKLWLNCNRGSILAPLLSAATTSSCSRKSSSCQNSTRKISGLFSRGSLTILRAFNLVLPVA